MLLSGVLLCGGVAQAQVVMGHDPYSTCLNNVTIQNMMRQQLLIQNAMRRAGREIIRTKRATTRFVPRAFPLQT